MTTKEAKEILHKTFTEDQRIVVAQLMEAYKDACVIPYRLGGSEKVLRMRDKWLELVRDL